MKKVLIVTLWLSVLVYADLSVDQVKQMITKIHEKREGVKLETLETTKEPFVSMKENNITTLSALKEDEEVKLSLHAIMNGKAFINDAWQSINDVIMGYTLKYIGKKGVVLRSGNHIRKLFLHKKRNNLIKIEER